MGQAGGPRAGGQAVRPGVAAAAAAPCSAAAAAAASPAAMSSTRAAPSGRPLAASTFLPLCGVGGVGVGVEGLTPRRRPRPHPLARARASPRPGLRPRPAARPPHLRAAHDRHSRKLVGPPGDELLHDEPARAAARAGDRDLPRRVRGRGGGGGRRRGAAWRGAPRATERRRAGRGARSVRGPRRAPAARPDRAAPQGGSLTFMAAACTRAAVARLRVAAREAEFAAGAAERDSMGLFCGFGRAPGVLGSRSRLGPVRSGRALDPRSPRGTPC
jgi:hypothetical protein